MAGRDKSLKSLIRLARWDVDEKQRVLSALQAREDEILAEIARQEQSLAHEKKVATRDAAVAGVGFPAYARAWLDNRAALETALEEIRREVELARDDLAEAFRQQKTYEITQAARDRRAREEADRKEQQVLDEIGLTLYRRKAKPPEGG
jgi:flagellar protein FliJ